MDRVQKERKKRMKWRVLPSLDDVLLAVIGRREREETHYRERTYESICLLSSLHFFWGKSRAR